MDNIIIGVDEAGRGPLFGSVYTGSATFYFDSNIDKTCLKDSKKYTKKSLLKTYDYINKNISFISYDYANCKEIDEYNILQATQNSMHRCIHKLITKIIEKKKEDNDFNTNIFSKIKLLIDGNYFKPFHYSYDDNIYFITHECVVKGDQLHKEISAASIIAKVERDNYIIDFIEKNPDYEEKYNLLNNKGYGTKKHIEGIRIHGYSEYHRKSFNLKCL
tara:strand:+ start:2891 stop:3544 length:654 start_codon:yes stop_codon:yes gene_type:complete